MSLEPCPACSRHLKTDEASCPFCATALPPSPRRAYAMAAAVTATALALGVACKDEVYAPLYGIPAMEDASVSDAGAPDAGS